MKCPRCIEDGTKSIVHGGGVSRTLMYGSRYYDEAGEYHNHDPNTSSAEFKCSKGHKFYMKSIASCPAEGCDYAGSSKVFILEDDGSHVEIVCE